MRRRLLICILLGIIALTGCGKEKEKEEEKIEVGNDQVSFVIKIT